MKDQRIYKKNSQPAQVTFRLRIHNKLDYSVDYVTISMLQNKESNT